MKISDLQKELQYAIKKHGDLEVRISIDSRLAEKSEPLDIKADFIQIIPERKIISIQNFPY